MLTNFIFDSTDTPSYSNNEAHNQHIDYAANRRLEIISDLQPCLSYLGVVRCSVKVYAIPRSGLVSSCTKRNAYGTMCIISPRFLQDDGPGHMRPGGSVAFRQVSWRHKLDLTCKQQNDAVH
jgi:hypothetical protein